MKISKSKAKKIGRKVTSKSKKTKVEHIPVENQLEAMKKVAAWAEREKIKMNFVIPEGVVYPDGTVSINKPSQKKANSHLFKGDEPRSPGRPKGSKNKITVALEQMGEDNARAVYQKLIELALAGDINACKIIIDRVYPLRKANRFSLEFDGPLDTLHDINVLSKHVTKLMVDGDISPDEAENYGKILEQRMKIITDTEVMSKIESTCQRVAEIKNGR